MLRNRSAVASAGHVPFFRMHTLPPASASCEALRRETRDPKRVSWAVVTVDAALADNTTPRQPTGDLTMSSGRRGDGAGAGVQHVCFVVRSNVLCTQYLSRLSQGSWIPPPSPPRWSMAVGSKPGGRTLHSPPRYLERFGRKRTAESAKGCSNSPNLDSGPPASRQTTARPHHGLPHPS